MVAWRYDGGVELPNYIRPDDLVKVVALACETASALESSASVSTDDGTAEGVSLSVVLPDIRSTDEAKSISVHLGRVGSEAENTIDVFWSASNPELSSIAVNGIDRTWVRGVTDILRSDIQKVVPKPPFAVPSASYLGIDSAYLLLPGAEVVVTPKPRPSSFLAASGLIAGLEDPSRPRRSRWRGLVGWWRGNKAAFYVEVTAGSVLLVLGAVWALVVR